MKYLTFGMANEKFCLMFIEQYLTLLQYFVKKIIENRGTLAIIFL